MMGFYEQISKYYDYIFPTGGSQLQFIKNSAGEPPKSILDVACGSGGYSVELARQGYRTAAVDLESEMVKKATDRAQRENVPLEALVCDMKELAQVFYGRHFDCIFCIGNSIVHLGSPGEIGSALRQMYDILDPKGSLVLQIINYDRIMKYKVSGLPPIKNEDIGLEFIRKYEYDEKSGLIHFNTALTVQEEGSIRHFDNSVALIPLRSTDMVRLLENAGFRKIELFGDFIGAAYEEHSYMLVVKAKK